MSIVVGDVLKVVTSLVWTDGEINQNVYNAVIGGSGGPYTDGDIVDDAGDWMDQIYANMAARCSDEIDGSQVQVYVYDAIDDDWDEVGSAGWTFNPTTAGDQLPRGVAGLVVAKTTDPDVSGKKYIPALTEDSIIDGLYSSGYLTAAVAFAIDWLTGFTGATSGASWVPGIWSPTETNFFAATLAYLVSAIPAYQRRRKNNVGV